VSLGVRKHEINEVDYLVQLTVSPTRMLLPASNSNSIVQVTVSTSQSSNVDEPRTLIQTEL